MHIKLLSSTVYGHNKNKFLAKHLKLKERVFEVLFPWAPQNSTLPPEIECYFYHKIHQERNRQWILMGKIDRVNENRAGYEL